MLLLVATVAAALVPAFHVGDLNIVIAMAIAITKAILVVLIFMHVKESGKLVWIFATRRVRLAGDHVRNHLRRLRIAQPHPSQPALRQPADTRAPAS